MNKLNKYWLIALTILGCVFAIALYKNWNKRPSQTITVLEDPLTTDVPMGDMMLPHYTAKNFDLANNLQGFTKKQIQEHEALYHGYVKKRNEIAQKLQTVDRATANNITYSPYRALKIAQSFAMNGDILHRLYFGNLGKKTDIGPEMMALIEKSFGSLESYKADLFAAGKSSRGWVITAYALDSGLIENYVLDAHNLTVPVMVMPLLVLDVYEHAYMIDFGINRGKYLATFWDDINWDIVEKRVEKWVTPFKDISFN